MLSPNEAASAAVPIPCPLWGVEEIQRAVVAGSSWLWHGYLGRGSVTLLTSRGKAGKTTLLSVLLGRLKSGGQLGGAMLEAGRAVIVSEEGPEHWLGRARKWQFGDNIGLWCRPFRGLPRLVDWLALLDRIGEEHARGKLDLAAVDPLAAFLPARRENSAGGLLEFLMPLQRLTNEGVSVLLSHHPRKGEPAPGEAARGSGALPSFADIVLEMAALPGAGPRDRRRCLRGFSRFEETPPQRVIEWTADGADYVSNGTVDEAEFLAQWLTLRAVLEKAPRKLNRREIRGRWPNPPRPALGTLYYWLQRAVEQGLVRRDGDGRKRRPFRYWLKERELHWLNDPMTLLHMPELIEEYENAAASVDLAS